MKASRHDVAPVIESEPRWLRQLRTSAEAADASGWLSASVSVSDLRQAIGACADGPGGEAVIAAVENGDVQVDFQKLVKAAYFTPDEAEAFAHALLKHAAAARRLRSARPCGCDPGANWTCETHRQQQQQRHLGVH